VGMSQETKDDERAEKTRSDPIDPTLQVKLDRWLWRVGSAVVLLFGVVGFAIYHTAELVATKALEGRLRDMLEDIQTTQRVVDNKLHDLESMSYADRARGAEAQMLVIEKLRDRVNVVQETLFSAVNEAKTKANQLDDDSQRARANIARLEEQLKAAKSVSDLLRDQHSAITDLASNGAVLDAITERLSTSITSDLAALKDRVDRGDLATSGAVAKLDALSSQSDDLRLSVERAHVRLAGIKLVVTNDAKPRKDGGDGDVDGARVRVKNETWARGGDGAVFGWGFEQCDDNGHLVIQYRRVGIAVPE